MNSLKTSLTDERVLRERRGGEELFDAVQCFVIALLFCGFSVGGGLSPFGVTFALSLPFEYICAALPGCAVGYAAVLGFSDTLRYWGALAFCGTLRAVLKGRVGEKSSNRVSPLISSAGVLLSGTVLLIVSGFSAQGLILIIGESVVSFCSGVMFRRSVFLAGTKSRVTALSFQDKAFLVCSICLLLLCASGYTAMGIAPARVLCFVVLMLVASFKGAAFASSAGIVSGAFLSASPGFSCLLPALAAGGFAAGLSARYGQLATAASFSVALIVTSLCQGKGESIFIIIAEGIIAFGVYSLAPSELLGKLREWLRKTGLMRDVKTDRQVAYELKRASESLHSVCDMINSVRGDTQTADDCDGKEDAAFRVRAEELQRVLTDQFSGIGDYLGELSVRINERRLYDSSVSAAIKSTLRESGLDVDGVEYFYADNGSSTAEITLTDRPFDIDWKDIREAIEFITGRRFDSPEVEVSQLRTTLIFNRSMPYRLQIGASKKSAHEGEPCGDSVSAAACVDGRGFVLISDGMGTGSPAARDSALTAKIMKKLICSGFTFDSALKTVNSALIGRSNQESFATVDAVEVNLFTGETLFYKAGAAQSIIRKKDRAVTLERSSMPLGMLRNIRFSKTRFTGEAGDIILLLSDGVTQNDCGWINDELLSWSTNNMQDLSNHILKLASLRADDKTADDMTVVAVKLEGVKK